MSQVKADYVLFTAPATLLRRIPITPALPAQQHEAIAKLKYGRGTKTLLQFSRRFWRVPGQPRAFGSPLPFGALWDGSEEQRGRAGILSLLAGGGASDATRSLTAKDGVAGLARSLDWLGSSNATLLASHHTVVGSRPVGARRLRVLRLVVRSRAAPLARAAGRTPVLRRRAHQHQVAGLHERRGRKRPPRGGGDRRHAPAGRLGK